MKRVSLLFLAVLLAGLLLAQRETSQPTSAIKPIESLWLMSLRRLGNQGDSDAALRKTLKEWRATGVFDAFVLAALPPTFADEKDFIRRANTLIQEVGGPFIFATLPVGTEGWESSANERLAKKQHGTQFDASKAVSQKQWLQTLTSVRADTWGWVLEQPARMPTPQQAARRATAADAGCPLLRTAAGEGNGRGAGRMQWRRGIQGTISEMVHGHELRQARHGVVEGSGGSERDADSGLQREALGQALARVMEAVLT